jgi:hypothetical protein
MESMGATESGMVLRPGDKIRFSGPAVEEFPKNDSIDFGPLADECLRQMTWVAFQTAHSYRSSEGYEDKADALQAGKQYVALAPDDWKP